MSYHQNVIDVENLINAERLSRTVNLAAMSASEREEYEIQQRVILSETVAEMNRRNFIRDLQKGQANMGVIGSNLPATQSNLIIVEQQLMGFAIPEQLQRTENYQEIMTTLDLAEDRILRHREYFEATGRTVLDDELQERVASIVYHQVNDYREQEQRRQQNIARANQPVILSDQEEAFLAPYIEQFEQQQDEAFIDQMLGFIPD